MSVTQDTIGNIGAAGAISSYWWLPELHTVSVLAAEIAPILGVIWLLTQLVIKLHDYRKKAKFRRDITAHLERH